ncbi:MAG: hypothetical protein C0412_21560 [Flavobacterium sp.]|nr:hypothetical protein [Flavobacterium sp.]
MNNFFYKYWWLYYLLFFLLIGVLIYLLLLKNNIDEVSTNYINSKNELEDCRNFYKKIDTVGAKIEKPDAIKIDNIYDCDASVNSGGLGKTVTKHELGKKSGTVIVDFDMENIPDSIVVIYDGKIIASSNGLVSGIDTISFEYKADNSKPSFCIVELAAPQNGTSWSYLLNCPQ